MKSDNSPAPVALAPPAATSWPAPGETPQTTGLDFQGPTLNPAPVPELAPSPDFDVWGFLEFADPIDDPAMLAFQVAQLTVGMGELLRMIRALQERGTNDERSE